MKFKKFLKYILFLCLLISVGFLYSFSSARNEQKKVSKVDIKIAAGTSKFLNHSMVNKLLIQKNESVKNLAKSVINLYGLESSISQNPYVEKAVVFLTIQGNLKTMVKQRTPIVRIIQDEDVYYVDKQGVNIPLSENYSARVLLVSGVKNDGEMKEIMPLIEAILEDSFLKKEIVGVEKLNTGEVQLAVRSGNYKIDFGSVTQIETKFRKLKAFYNNTFSDKTIQNYKTINVKFHNQVVCTK
jgi:cell division protein FtsQ